MSRLGANICGGIAFMIVAWVAMYFGWYPARFVEGVSVIGCCLAYDLVYAIARGELK